MQSSIPPASIGRRCGLVLSAGGARGAYQAGALKGGTFWLGAKALTDRLFRPASTYMPTTPALELMYDADLPLHEEAQVCLALGLLTQDADARTTTTDVLIAAIDDGRINGVELGEVLGRMRKTNPKSVRFGKIASGLQPVQQAGPAQQLACARLLETLLSTLNDLPKDAHHLLELLLELLTALDRGCQPSLVPLLSSASGSGKTAKLCKQITKRPATSGVPQAVFASLLDSRLQRIASWQDRVGTLQPTGEAPV